MKKYVSEHFKETYYYEKIDNGLNVFLMPKDGFSVSYAVLTTKYGSLDNKFIPNNQSEYVELPLGIAHFLEHKMFEMPSKIDVNSLFAEIGADVNAYTTYDYTGYYFSTTRNLPKALNLLLDFVQTKGYTPESIEEERGIIEQELLMYLDDPNIRLQIEALKTMYQKNLVRDDIGGTISSIKNINMELLDLCYENFYTPYNMCLVVIGKFNLEEIVKIIKSNQNNKKYINQQDIKRKYYVETQEVYQKYNEITMDVMIPKVSVNLKLGYEALSIEKLIKKDYALSALMYQEFDITSDFYQKTENTNIINNSFDYDVVLEKTYGYITLTTDTYQPQVFITEVVNHLKKMSKIEVSQESFERYKKITEARILKKMNNVEYLGNVLIESYFDKIEMFRYLELIKELAYDDVLGVRKYFVEEAISVVVIKN